MESTSEYKRLLLGIDVGSTTVKAVVMSSDQTILWKHYQRHNARQPELVRDFLKQIGQRFSSCALSTFITGSGGRAIAPHINARYVQEVNAVTYAVERLYPQTGSVIELGGQDAKVIIWKQDSQGRKSTLTFMNDKCAGGTGATIDKILGKIGLSMEQAAKVSMEGKTMHHIAAKCGVFAETDVVGLLKAGVDEEEILVSLAGAIARQNLEVLVKGNVLRDNVLLLGGPHTFLPVFTQIWRTLIPQTWQIHHWKPSERQSEELIHVPRDAQYFAALGAVLFGQESDNLFSAMHHGQETDKHFLSGIERLEHYIAQGRIAQLESSGAVRDGLVKSEEEKEVFVRKYRIPPFTVPHFDPGTTVSGYIGIDGGSTSSKMALVDEQGGLIYKDYVLSKGNPIIDIRDMFQRLGEWATGSGVSLQILGAGVTGYASSILKEAFDLDISVVETVAHMKAAAAYYGDVDVICDIGGQDIKVLFMKHGRVVDFKLNTQCSAGNGYFLQGMADQFGIPIEQYADYAFKARKAPAFNYGCAVFMEQDKVNFQQLGWAKEEIMAGLALVLPLNIWNYVVQETNLARLGNTIVLQGGTQKNLAAVKAQVDYIQDRLPHATVHVHRYADICGAIGAAIEVKETRGGGQSSFIGVSDASKISFESRNDSTTRCRFCGNRCPRTFIDIHVTRDKKVRFITGYGCERGMAESADIMRLREQEKRRNKEKYPNLVDRAARLAFDEFAFEALPRETKRFSRSGEQAIKKREQLVIGIPRLLNMYLYAPFFSTYFRALGVKEIRYSNYTSAQLWHEGNKWGAIDPCFPAKVAPAHIYDLLKQEDLTHICFPRITHLESVVGNTLGNNACVIQMGTPEVVHAVFTREIDYFADCSVGFWKPLIRMDRQREVVGEMYAYFKEEMGITEDENAWAVSQGFKAQGHYLDILREQGARIINQLIDEDRIGILVLGHPYHHDPGLNHGILDEFQKRGFAILCIESLPVDESFLKPLFCGEPDMSTVPRELDIKDIWQRNFNRNTNLKIWGAKIAARHPNLAVIDLSSFKCGHDAPTYSYIDNVLDASETPHFLFHDIDQNKPRATIDIRIQTIDYFLHLEEQRLRARIEESHS
ncbi:MAG: BadF/BadG/BcrA/BcrD ATPase family protein [Chitinispirillaceae bacterium]